MTRSKLDNLAYVLCINLSVSQFIFHALTLLSSCKTAMVLTFVDENPLWF